MVVEEVERFGDMTSARTWARCQDHYCHSHAHGEAHYAVERTASSDFTGPIHVTAHVAIDETKRTKPEDPLIDSPWNATGAGR